MRILTSRRLRQWVNLGVNLGVMRGPAPLALLVGSTLLLAHPAAAHVGDGALGILHGHPHGASLANPIGLVIVAGLLLLVAIAPALLARRPAR